MLRLFPFTYCVYLTLTLTDVGGRFYSYLLTLTQPELHLVIILHSINKLNTNAKPKQTVQGSQRKQKVKRKEAEKCLSRGGAMRGGMQII